MVGWQLRKTVGREKRVHPFQWSGPFDVDSLGGPHCSSQVNAQVVTPGCELTLLHSLLNIIGAFASNTDCRVEGAAVIEPKPTVDLWQVQRLDEFASGQIGKPIRFVIDQGTLAYSACCKVCITVFKAWLLHIPAYILPFLALLYDLEIIAPIPAQIARDTVFA